MDKRVANNLILGLFLLVGFLGFLFVIFSIGGGTGFFRSNYTLVAKFSHVKGLHAGSEVTLSGLRIGVVSDIKLPKASSRELEIFMSISKSVQDQIRHDSVAIIRTQGVLGDKFLEITIGSPDAAVLKNGDPITTQEESDLFAKSGNVLKGLETHFEKGGSVEKLLVNLGKTAENLNVLTSQMRQNKSGDKLGKSLAHLEAILKKIDDGEGTLGGLVSDPTVYEDIKSMVSGASRSNMLKSFIRDFVDDGSKNKTKTKKSE